MIVKTVCGWVKGFILLYGIHIVLYGHLTPGGGFAGGAIIAGAFILLVLAYGSKLLKLQKIEAGSSVVESMGILSFILLAAFALFIGTKVFFTNYLPKGKIGELISAGVIPLYNIAVGIEVAAAIFTIFLALLIYKEEISK